MHERAMLIGSAGSLKLTSVDFFSWLLFLCFPVEIACLFRYLVISCTVYGMCTCTCQEKLSGNKLRFINITGRRKISVQRACAVDFARKSIQTIRLLLTFPVLWLKNTFICLLFWQFGGIRGVKKTKKSKVHYTTCAIHARNAGRKTKLSLMSSGRDVGHWWLLCVYFSLAAFIMVAILENCYLYSNEWLKLNYFRYISLTHFTLIISAY